MARYKKFLLDAFKPHFKEQGFEKKNATWHLGTPEAVHVFNVQTSQWSESYYFNVGVYFRALGPLDSPAEWQCHIRDRIPDEKSYRDMLRRANGLSNFEDVESCVEERISELTNLIYPLVLDWFSRFGNAASAKKELAQIRRPWFTVSNTVWPLIGLSLPK